MRRSELSTHFYPLMVTDVHYEGLLNNQTVYKDVDRCACVCVCKCLNRNEEEQKEKKTEREKGELNKKTQTKPVSKNKRLI